MNHLRAIARALANMEEGQVLKLVKDALNANVSATDILKACQQGMVDVGNRFECGDYFVSELLMSGAIFKEISGLLEPLLKVDGTQSAGKVVIGTV